jgi:eukaryotic-like serine/threonine-protein kinase
VGGRTVLGRYRVERLLATGGMGEIHLAQQIGVAGTERRVILKTVRRDRATEASYIEQFLDEARVAASISHPNVVGIYEVIEDESAFYLAMEYIAGIDVAQLLARLRKTGSTLPSRVAASIVRDAALGLDHAHRAKGSDGKPLRIVHRDVSPQNLMVRTDGVVKVVDFGIAKADNRLHRTMDASVIKGKAIYMSPEQALGEDIDGRSDQYSLGVVLWEILMMRRLHDTGRPDREVLRKIVDEDVPPLAPELPAALRRIVGRMTARARALRYPALSDVAAALGGYLAETGGPAHDEAADLVRRLLDGEAVSNADTERVQRSRTLVDTQALPEYEDAPRATRYEIVRKLGAGAKGVVWEAFDVEQRRSVALKSLARADAASLYRFKKEFRSLASFTHENLARIYDLVVDDDERFFTMELIDGQELMAAVRDEHGALRVERLRECLAQVARALVALHDAGVVHRDLKPSNVLVTEAGRLVVLDFGLATEFKAPDARQTVDSSGTPLYMAPEQLQGAALSPSADLYALGAMLFEALTGAAPFQGALAEVVAQKLSGKQPRVIDRNPSAPKELAALADALLSVDPEARPTARDVLEACAAPIDGARTTPVRRIHDTLVDARVPPLVGRGELLDELFAALARAERGHPALMFVHGASGMGKSALVRRFIFECAQRPRPVVVLEGRCFEREAVPFKAFDGVVDALSRHLALLPPEDARALLPRDLSALQKLFPVIARVDVVERAQRRALGAVDPAELRRRAFAAVRELLGRLSEQAPVVVCVDDAQWGDLDSAALLFELLRPPDPPPLLLLLAYRTEEATGSAFVSRLTSPGVQGFPGVDVRHAEIGPLSPADAEEMARELLAGHPRRELDAQPIARESQGHPFFIDALARFTRVGGEAAARGRSPTLREAMRAGLARLPEPSLRLLEVLSVASTPLRIQVAARAAGEDNAHAAAEPLLDLRAPWARTRGEHIEPYHDRLREVVVHDLRAEQLSSMHHAIAEALIEESAEPELVAHHLFAAGEGERAVAFSIAAGDGALSALAFDRAAHHFERALGAMPAAAADRARVEEARGRSLELAGRGADAARAYLVAASALSAGESAVLDLRRRAGSLLLRSGRVDEGVAVFREVMSAVGLKLPETAAEIILPFILIRARLALRGARFTARDPAAAPRARLLEIDIQRDASAGLVNGVNPLSAMLLSLRALVGALEVGDARRVAPLLAGYAAARSVVEGAGATAAIDAINAQVLEHIAALHDPLIDGEVHTQIGGCHLFRGRFDAALRSLDSGEATLRECLGAWHLLGYNHYLKNACYLAADRWGALSAHATKVLAEAEAHDDVFSRCDALLHMARAALMADDVPRARAIIDEAERSWTARGYQIMRYLICYYACVVESYAGRADAALARLDAEWPLIERALLLKIPLVATYARHLRGALVLRVAMQAPGSERSELVKRARKEAVAIDRVGSAWARTRAEMLRAGVASLAEWERAEQAVRGHLRRAVARAEEVGLAVHAGLARLRLGARIGGEEGRHLVEDGTRGLLAEGIVEPARWADVFCPLLPAP